MFKQPDYQSDHDTGEGNENIPTEEVKVGSPLVDPGTKVADRADDAVDGGIVFPGQSL
jgi:hypothetical protein